MQFLSRILEQMNIHIIALLKSVQLTHWKMVHVRPGPAYRDFDIGLGFFGSVAKSQPRLSMYGWRMAYALSLTRAANT